MTAGERIQIILNYTKLNQVAFAKEISLQNSNILSYVITGRNSISKRLAQKIKSRYPELSIGWIMTGAGNMFDDKEKPVIIDYSAQDVRDLIDTVRRLTATLENVLLKKKLL